MRVQKICAVTLCSAALVLAGEAGAQQKPSPIDRGSMIIGGTASLSRQHENESDATATLVLAQPTTLVFIAPRLALGGTITVGYSSFMGGHTTTYGVGPSARYYFGDPAGKLFPFLSASVLPQWDRQHINESDASAGEPLDQTMRLLALDGALGLTCLVATHVGVTGEAYYTHSEFTANSVLANRTQTSYTYGLRFGITAFVR
jgi:hypothetical protein